MNAKPRVINAIRVLHPTAKFNLINGDDWEHVEWTDKSIAKPTDSEVSTKLASMISDWEAQEYARDRAISYPSVGDQLDMMMKDMKNGTTTHQIACEAVKAQFPKPE
jgi:hypothetical protein